VECRVLVDGMGSKSLIRSNLWKELQNSKVKTAIAFPVKNPLRWLVGQRIDLRNHRKIVVIDNHITYTGSQNCADPEFRIKPRYAPWVDIMGRFVGPIAQQNQFIFVFDWKTSAGEDLSH